MKIIDTKGVPVEHLHYPYISTMWHNSLDGVYCHHADLFFKSSSENSNNLAIVSIQLAKLSQLSSKTPKSYTKDIRRYFYYYRDCDVIRIPLYLEEVLNALVANEWTSTGKGNRNKHIEYPLKIEWEFGDEKYSFDFDSKRGLTPALLCEKLTCDMKKDQKEEIIICFKQNSEQPKNLFDFID